MLLPFSDRRDGNTAPPLVAIVVHHVGGHSGQAGGHINDGGLKVVAHAEPICAGGPQEVMSARTQPAGADCMGETSTNRGSLAGPPLPQSVWPPPSPTQRAPCDEK